MRSPLLGDGVRGRTRGGRGGVHHSVYEGGDRGVVGRLGAARDHRGGRLIVLRVLLVKPHEVVVRAQDHLNVFAREVELLDHIAVALVSEDTERDARVGGKGPDHLVPDIAPVAVGPRGSGVLEEGVQPPHDSLLVGPDVDGEKELLPRIRPAQDQGRFSEVGPRVHSREPVGKLDASHVDSLVETNRAARVCLIVHGGLLPEI